MASASDWRRAVDFAFDPIVTTKDGSFVWNRLAGQVLGGTPIYTGIAAGGQMRFTTLWRLRTPTGVAIAAGEYRVLGRLLLEGDTLYSEPTSLLVRAR